MRQGSEERLSDLGRPPGVSFPEKFERTSEGIVYAGEMSTQHVACSKNRHHPLPPLNQTQATESRLSIVTASLHTLCKS
jgi:hypothetical protein